ncbi:response regulator [Robinsoniella peoriensis]
MKYRLLMIDDEELIRKGFLARLQYLNLEFEEILEASSGKEALLLLENKSVDIVVTDIHMPDMDGLAFIAEAKPLYPHMKYIILSGYAEFAYAEQAISLGAKAYLLKPLSNGELKKVMEKTIQSLEEDERIRNTISSQTKLQKEKEQYTLEKGINALVSKQVMETEEKGFLYELLSGDHPRFFSPGCIHFLGIINIDGRSYSGSKFGHEDIDLIRFSIKNVFLEIVSVCDKVMVDNLSNYNQLFGDIFPGKREAFAK